ncbi:hypothetical protein BFJ63_vAg16377 [Fusarium oxysporum f. sp. narcissi]|nr:hypothetical protein RAB80_014409 [Fusarium oxysporum f. sp. vasinfectum]RYC80730.1 hypothetical protein BFJ63_vAg16377 [Fusarium oxysporum f. sp. narcissi]
MSTTVYSQLNKEQMIHKATELLGQVKEAEASVTQETTNFIQTETSRVLLDGRGTDTSVYFDVSGSMGHYDSRPWNIQHAIVEGIVPTAAEYDSDGIDLIAIMEESPMEEGRKSKVKDLKVAMEFVNKFRQNLRGTTPTRQLFKKDVRAHVAACIKDPNNTKRLNIVIVTDGEPSDTHNDSMTKTTEWATLELSSAGRSPKEYLGISYVIVTEQLHTMACYRMLEDRTSWGEGDKAVECDMSNAIYPFTITALGGPYKQIVINLILAANNSDPLDRAPEKLFQGAPENFIQLMDAYIEKGYAEEV